MVLHEGAIRRNRRRIPALTVLAVLNFWVGAIVFVFCVVVGALLALVAEGIIGGLDFDLAVALAGALPRAGRWFVRDALTSPVATVIVLGFVAAGSLLALFTLLFRLSHVAGASRLDAPITTLQRLLRDPESDGTLAGDRGDE